MRLSLVPSVTDGASTGRTLVADLAAERRIDLDLADVRDAVAGALGARMVALLLVGGYARREGSVVARQGGLGPYNDYDLVAVVRGRTRPVRGPLADLGTRLRERLSVDVDVWPISERDLGRVPPTLFWLDVSLGGAEVLAGDAAVLERIRPVEPRDVPLDECGRLLANRATGIALSNLEAEDRDLRCARHAHKAVLAAGDARLLTANRYSGTFAERLAVIEQLAHAPAVGPTLVDAYRDAVAFRARPDAWTPPGGDLRRWYARTCDDVGRWHLDYEAWRVGAPFTPRAFARWRGRLYRRAPDLRRGGRAFAAARAALRREAPLLPWLGHPRERLARVSVLLAYGAHDVGCRREAALLLGIGPGRADDRQALHAALRTLSERGG